ncbi:MAG TPA: glycosyltransferase family 2 protein, partial [Candidatus Saccharimonadales bacterium]
MKRPVTIIVPVYGDWPSLSECIESLKEHVDRRHTVLLVNDKGPEAETIGANIQRAIKGVKNFSYHENKENLGFLQNCNHAVFDLDATNNDILLLNSDTRVTKGFLEEMLAVLYANEEHGAVSPRSNNATIFTLPFQRAYPVKADLTEDMAYCWGTFQAVKGKLARYTEVPVGHGFCLLIRRSLIAKYGLFDEIYGKGYGEESDFCMRIRQQGYKSVMANHAFVFHFESRSFTSERRKALVAEHAKIVARRYPEHDGLIAQYIEAM